MASWLRSSAADTSTSQIRASVGARRMRSAGRRDRIAIYSTGRNPSQGAKLIRNWIRKHREH